MATCVKFTSFCIRKPINQPKEIPNLRLILNTDQPTTHSGLQMLKTLRKYSKSQKTNKKMYIYQLSVYAPDIVLSAGGGWGGCVGEDCNNLSWKSNA